MGIFPIIDFSRYGLNVADPTSVSDVTLQPLVAEVMSSLTSHGFMYLRNHGIPQSTVDNVLASSSMFFELPVSEKEKCRMTTTNNNGWIPADGESVDPKNPGDLKETVNYDPVGNLTNDGWPKDTIPAFLGDLETSYHQFYALAQRVMALMSLGLGKDRDYFERFHKKIATKGNRSLLRSNYYPAVTAKAQLKPGQLRLGEHCDIGSVTILCNDENEGLEVFRPDVGYVPVPPVPGALIVNLGLAMQRWTADTLPAVRHRVVIPASPEAQQRARRSLLLFVNPDDDAPVGCLDGSDKYPNLSMGDFLSCMVKKNFGES